MAAVLEIPTHRDPARLRSVPAPVSAHEYRRRRLVALLMGVLVLVGSFWMMRSLVHAATDVPSVSPGTATTRVVVQPGDTVTSIAAQFAEGGAQRELVGQIVALNGGASLVAGQALFVPVG